LYFSEILFSGLLQRFEFHPSRYLTIMLFAVHGAALAALLPLALPLWAKLAIVFLLLLSLLYYLLRDAWLSVRISCVGLVLEGDDVILLMRDDTRLPCVILHDTLVTPYLTVLNVLPQDARFARSVVILPDSMDAEAFRQLRVRLKWGDQTTL
jgi:toxin CptA